MITRDDILTLIPHQGAMCIWDGVIAWDEDRIELVAHNHRDASHPLRSDDTLRAVHLCEYGAQAMAVHGGLLAQRRGERAPAGMLVALRGVQLHLARIDDLDDDLMCHAEVLAQGGGSQQYGFRILHRGQLLAEGRAAVMLQLP